MLWPLFVVKQRPIMSIIRRLFENLLTKLRLPGPYRPGTGNHQYRLWALLMWEMWRERWLE